MKSTSIDRFSYGTTETSFTWKELEIRFRQVRANAPQYHRVCAWLGRTEWPSGAVAEEWRVGGDPSSQKEFEYLASISAQKLGYVYRDDGYKEWLGRVRMWLRETGLDKDRNVVLSAGYFDKYGEVTGFTKSLYTEKIAELSANFCMNLMARGIPELSVSPQSRQRQTPEHDEHDSKPNPRVKKVRKTERQMRRMAVIFGAIQSGLIGLKYCAALDGRRLRPPDHWIEGFCPPTYVRAYIAYIEASWAKRIQDEKCTYRKQYDRIPNPQREEIIQGEKSTHRTRQ